MDLQEKSVRSLEQLEEKYSFLYVSDPSRLIQQPSMRELDRFLAESSGGNASANGTCNGAYQIESSLLGGLLAVSSSPLSFLLF